eukprot:Hpha_TRINITY_DN16015_c5_g7::TRINITY_DN16015_c5_g7_i1::g.117138::m.117138
MVRFPGWETKGAGSWGQVWVWYSPDGTPYQYTSYLHIGQRMHGTGLLKDSVVVGKGFVYFYSWTNILVSLGLQGKVVVVSGSAVILATNTGSKMNKDCFTEYGRDFGDGFQEGELHPCVLQVKNEDPASAAGIRVLAQSPDDQFMKRELEGEEHFLFRKTIFSPGPNDQLEEIWLAWMRSVNSVEAKVLRSLFFFIGFIGAVLVFACLAVVLEIRMIGRPLGWLRKAVRHVDSMALAEARLELEKHNVSSGCFVIADVQDLWRSFLHTVDCLQEFSEFLPGTILEQPRPDESVSEGPSVSSVLPPGSLSESDTPVGIVFTDIQSSTSLWERDPNAMHQAVRIHYYVLRECAKKWNGYEVKVIGDAMMLAFTLARDAVEFGLDAQIDLVQSSWPVDLLSHSLCKRVEGPDGIPLWNGVRVRIGVNWGPARPEINMVTHRWDYFGSTVNVAARVESALKVGGLTGVTDAALEAVVPEVNRPDVFICKMGDLELRGVTHKVGISVMLPRSLADRWTNFVRGALKQGGSFPFRQQSPPSSISAKSGGESSPLALRGWVSRLGIGLHPSTASVAAARGSFKGVAEQVLLASVSWFLVAVQTSAIRTQGVVKSVLSAVCVVTWNAGDSCTSHQQQCARFTTLLPNHEAPAHVGATTGRVHAGNVAGVRGRHVTVIGKSVELALTLAEAAALSNVSFLAAGEVGQLLCSEGRAHFAEQWQEAGGDSLSVFRPNPNTTNVSDVGEDDDMKRHSRKTPLISPVGDLPPTGAYPLNPLLPGAGGEERRSDIAKSNPTLQSYNETSSQRTGEDGGGAVEDAALYQGGDLILPASALGPQCRVFHGSIPSWT